MATWYLPYVIMYMPALRPTLCSFNNNRCSITSTFQCKCLHESIAQEHTCAEGSCIKGQLQTAQLLPELIGKICRGLASPSHFAKCRNQTTIGDEVWSQASCLNLPKDLKCRVGFASLSSHQCQECYRQVCIPCKLLSPQPAKARNCSTQALP